MLHTADGDSEGEGDGPQLNALGEPLDPCEAPPETIYTAFKSIANLNKNTDVSLSYDGIET